METLYQYLVEKGLNITLDEFITLIKKNEKEIYELIGSRPTDRK